MKGPYERNRHKKRVKGVGKLGWFMSRTQTLTSPPREGEPAGTIRGRRKDKPVRTTSKPLVLTPALLKKPIFLPKMVSRSN